MVAELLADNEKLVARFGASRFSSLKTVPDFYTPAEPQIHLLPGLPPYLFFKKGTGLSRCMELEIYPGLPL